MKEQKYAAKEIMNTVGGSKAYISQLLGQVEERIREKSEGTYYYIVNQERSNIGNRNRDEIESMPYSLDFRKHALAFMDRGHTFAELKVAFNTFPSTLTAWRKLLNGTAELKPRPIPRLATEINFH